MQDNVLQSKYTRLKHDLETTGMGSMKCFGNSMLPILPNASTCYYEVRDSYNKGDIVFCKVKGRWIDSHLITGVKIEKGIKVYKISNNHGHDNGWTSTIYGKVIKSIDNIGRIKEFK